MKKRILVVDDNRGVAETLGEVIKSLCPGVEITLTFDGHEGLQALEVEEFDILFSDIDMPRMDGLEMIFEARKRQIALPVIILMSADPPDEESELVKLLGIQTVLQKPFGIKEIQAILGGIA